MAQAGYTFGQRVSAATLTVLGSLEPGQWARLGELAAKRCEGRISLEAWQNAALSVCEGAILQVESAGQNPRQKV